MGAKKVQLLSCWNVELNTAQRLERLGLKSDPFYTMMAALGLENWAIVPLEVCASKGHCLKQEKCWMRKLGAVFM